MFKTYEKMTGEKGSYDGSNPKKFGIADEGDVISMGYKKIEDGSGGKGKKGLSLPRRRMVI